MAKQAWKVREIEQSPLLLLLLLCLLFSGEKKSAVRHVYSANV